VHKNGKEIKRKDGFSVIVSYGIPWKREEQMPEENFFPSLQ